MKTFVRKVRSRQDDVNWKVTGSNLGAGKIFSSLNPRYSELVQSSSIEICTLNM